MGQSPDEMPAKGVVAPLILAGVRSRIAAGDLALAREMHRALLGRLGPTADVLITEATLEEAEGRLDAALASLEQIVTAAPRWVHPQALAARVLWGLGRADEAEGAALTALALEPANLIGLTVLAEIYAKAGRTGDRLNVLARLALCAGAPGSAVWSAVAELSGAERWEDVLRVLDRRGDLPAGRRPAVTRAEALLALGRQREAVASLLETLGKGEARPREMVDLLLARNALTAAALFHRAAIEGGRPIPGARARTIAEAGRICEATTFEDAPFAHADALRALEILWPGQKRRARPVTLAAASLIERARGHLARGEFSLAADHLIHAARLRPDDLDILRLLAEAAAKAGRSDRHLDTLLRIHQVLATAGSLLAAADGAYATGRWAVLASLMTKASGPEPARAAMDWADRMFAGLCARVLGLEREGDGEEGLAMVAALAPWIDVSRWPRDAISRLLAAAKRRMRAPRMAVDPTALGRLAADFLVVDPTDLDVARLAARLHLRLRRFGEAVELLTRALRADPHVARDWIDLAMAYHELGDGERRDACAARALVIAPATVLPKPIAAVRARIEAAHP